MFNLLKFNYLEILLRILLIYLLIFIIFTLYIYEFEFQKKIMDCFEIADIKETFETTEHQKKSLQF